MSAIAQAKRIRWHYVPYPGHCSDDAARYVGALTVALTEWIARTCAGTLTPIPTMADDDEIRCALAGALARCAEWTGTNLILDLATVSKWPVDQALSATIQRWSCSLKTAQINASKDRERLRREART